MRRSACQRALPRRARSRCAGHVAAAALAVAALAAPSPALARDTGPQVDGFAGTAGSVEATVGGPIPRWGHSLAAPRRGEVRGVVARSQAIERSTPSSLPDPRPLALAIMALAGIGAAVRLTSARAR